MDDNFDDLFTKNSSYAEADYELQREYIPAEPVRRMSFPEAIKSIHTHFNGRARRSEFIWGVLFESIIIPINLSLFFFPYSLGDFVFRIITQVQWIFMILLVYNGIVSISLLRRRFHDMGYPLNLASFIFLFLTMPAYFYGRFSLNLDVGATVDKYYRPSCIIAIGIIILIGALKDSQPGANQYGPNPKGVLLY